MATKPIIRLRLFWAWLAAPKTSLNYNNGPIIKYSLLLDDKSHEGNRPPLTEENLDNARMQSEGKCKVKAPKRSLVKDELVVNV